MTAKRKGRKNRRRWRREVESLNKIGFSFYNGISIIKLSSRGDLPSHLLWRYDSNLTDYSDGASGIFRSGIETVSTRGTHCSSMSIDTYRDSFAWKWSTITDLWAISVMLNSTELETSSSRGNFVMNEDTRIIRSIRESIDNDSKTASNATDLNGSVNRESDEDSSNITSSKSISITLATLLTDYRNESVDVPNNNNFVSDFYTDPELMFSPGAPLPDQNEEFTGKFSQQFVIPWYWLFFRKNAMQW